jgi:hypothetical protein
VAIMLPTFTKKDIRPMDFNHTLRKNASDRGLLGPRPEERPLPPPNAAHDTLMRKARALVEKVAKSGTGKPITLETAYEKMLSDPSNRALAQAALRPASRKGAPPADEYGGEDEGDGGPVSSEDDGGNSAQNARSAVTGRLKPDKDKTGRPASATRTFGLGGRKAKVAARVQKFFMLCPAASDDEALGYALSPKRVRKGVRGQTKGELKSALRRPGSLALQLELPGLPSSVLTQGRAPRNGYGRPAGWGPARLTPGHSNGENAVSWRSSGSYSKAQDRNGYHRHCKGDCERKPVASSVGQ